MNRDEVEVSLSREGFWKPYSIEITLPAGLTVVGRGWSVSGALRNAKKRVVKVVGIILGDAE